jgi:hypothetical protein
MKDVTWMNSLQPPSLVFVTDLELEGLREALGKDEVFSEQTEYVGSVSLQIILPPCGLGRRYLSEERNSDEQPLSSSAGMKFLGDECSKHLHLRR